MINQKIFRYFYFKFVALVRYLTVQGYFYRISNLFYSKNYQDNLKHIFNVDSRVKFNLDKLSVPETHFKQFILYMPRFVTRDLNTMESDLYFAYKNSLDELNRTVELIAPTGSNLIVKNANEVLLIMSGHSLLNLSEDQASELKLFRLRGGTILFDHPDLIKTKNGEKLLADCFQLADFGVVHNPLLELNMYSDKSILWPTYPFADIFKSDLALEKEDAVLFSGTAFRGFHGRRYYLDYAQKHGLKTINFMHSNNFSKNALHGYLEYLQSMDKCKLSFTTGFRSQKESLLAFRAIELMLRGVVVLYEEGSFIDYFFKPYVHYIPVKNAPDMCLKAELLLKNPELVKKMSQCAKTHVENKYSSRVFWSEVEYKLEKLASRKLLNN